MKMLKNKKALSTVVTTLIILVVSVLLATVVTFYAINVTTTRVQEESLQITKLHVWHNGTDALAAFLITNTGGRDVVLEKITVRGQMCNWTDVYYANPTGASDLAWIAPENLRTEGYSPANSNLILKSGGSIAIYIENPDHISVSDIGITVGVTVFTANAQYYKEANVEASS